jgi:hypothetical protein
MPIAVTPYLPAHVPGVQALNRRLREGGVEGFEFPETPDPGWMPGMELFVATEGDHVRGGYILRRQEFVIGGQVVLAAHYRLPVSEGLIDRAYASLGLRLVRDALARQPRLYAMGMGGWDKPLPQMLKALKWRMSEVPFHFKVVHPARFLRNIRALRTSGARRVAMDVAAVSGAGWLGMKALGLAHRLPKVEFETAASFAGWGDEVWSRSNAEYGVLGVRDAATLDALYPATDARFLRVRAAGGWAVLLDTQMHGHKQFGDMRVGTIVDCLAPVGAAETVARAAAAVLEGRGVDLIVSNQIHASWSLGLKAAGFRTGPSNYLVALSPGFGAAGDDGSFHFNRGDGDGPIHL